MPRNTASRLKIPQQLPRGDALLDQLMDLHIVSARLGMYDAADWLWKQIVAINDK